MKETLKETEDRMKKTVELLRKELASMKAGRATPALLDKITVDYYGTPTPVNQMATISAPEPRLLVIQPWDKGTLASLSKAILKSDLGITPVSDGTVIRLAIPQLTRERRMELVKGIKKKAEEEKVVIRNIRRDTNELLKEMEDEGEITEDENRRALEDVQKLTDKYVKEIDHVVEVKEKEVMEV
ncbi:MAG: ribosome recycling factor [Firmicutes bacterium]|nr:ribosome recycling factor [Bacillota bacterium]MCL5038587.1 ribosome recycling factor [Bacillota bacterium]